MPTDQALALAPEPPESMARDKVRPAMPINPIVCHQRAEEIEKRSLAAPDQELTAYYREIAQTWRLLAQIAERCHALDETPH